mmetsp:Transcript_9646/g.58463  ORF Transcript_9646/g.58463 Transcript_9646/m.58463 type:complete len:82 (-) Transcript_9646:136-381(-)
MSARPCMGCVWGWVCLMAGEEQGNDPTRPYVDLQIAILPAEERYGRDRIRRDMGNAGEGFCEEIAKGKRVSSRDEMAGICL